MVNRANWVRRRWLDFRQGHTVYLVFAMTFLNFITIQYELLVTKQVETNPEVGSIITSIFPSVWIFAVIFVAAYLPLGMIIGYWHRKSQWKIEQEAAFRENVIGARMWLFMLELIEGNVSEEEKHQVRKMLRQIMKKNPTDKIDRLGNTVEEGTGPVEQQKEDAQK